MALELAGTALISASIQVLLDRLASPDVAAWLRQKLKRSDFERLSRRLRTTASLVTAVLDDAERKLVRRISGVEEWLDELQQAAFDADELLDDIGTQALRLKVEAESRAGYTKVRKLLRQKRRFRNVFSRSRVEREIEKVVSRLEEIAGKKDILGLQHVVTEKPMSQRLPSTSLLEEYGVFGRDEEEAVIKSLLSDDEGGSTSKIGVVPIIGMGGLGKTTLAQLVYNDDEMKETFELKAWVCVSQNMDVCRVTRTILEAVTSASPDVTDLNLLQIRLKARLKGKKFLIVMDDMWHVSYDDWQAIARPFVDGARGSKIIVTTRSEKVAGVVTTGPVHHLKVFSYKTSLQLFSKHAFGNGELGDHPELESIGREIIMKCKGLPLAVKTLGGLLRSTRDVGDWERILKSEIWDLADEESNILPALRLSYNCLPSHLKRCFAYCSVFPKTFEFRKEEMILLWMAENLLPNSDGNKRIEEVGEECFNELVSRSFFQRSSIHRSFSLWYTIEDHILLREDARTTSKHIFVMHDLMHDLAKYVSAKYCLHLQDERSGEISGRKVRHLTYIAAENDPHKRFNCFSEATNMHTFLPIQHCESLNSNGISLKLVRDWLLKLRCLRVLSLSGYTISGLPDSIGELRHLRYLDLSHTFIIRLPKSICELFNLQTLKLNSCQKLKKLPKEMHRLINMRYLDVRFCDKLVEMPTQISKLKNLQMLSTFIVGKGNGTEIGQLRELSNLEGELCIKNLENVVNIKNTKLSHPKLMEKKRLEALVLEWSHSNDDSTQARNVLDMLLPNKALKRLRIDNYSGIGFPNWIGDDSLGNIVFLELCKCRYAKSLPPVGQLLSLKTLILSEFDALENVGPEFYGKGSALMPFPSLQTLNFCSMPSWEQWIQVEDAGNFAKLKELEISDCEKLVGNLPYFLPSLMKLNISGCKKLVVSLPRMPAICEIKFGGCEDQAQAESFFKALKQMETSPPHLRISDCSSLVPAGCLPTTLETLDIVECKNLEFPLGHRNESLEVLFVDKSCDSLRSLPLDSFPKLSKLAITDCKSLHSLSMSDELCQNMSSLSFLHITDCPKFASFPKDGLRASNLFFLQIAGCMELKSLPEKMHDLLPSLELLEIRNCPEIDSFPDGGLPLNLSSLIIMECDKIMASRRSWNLQTLSNLTSLTIWGTGRYEDLKSFPEEGLIPATILELTLCKFPGLKELDENGLRQLSSLKELYISDCPKSKTMPKEGLPFSLEYFEIENCPRLEKKCRRKNGKYWSKIDRIHCIKIDNKIVS